MATHAGSQEQITEMLVAKLAPGFSGDLFGPGDTGYPEARLVWNGMIDRWPAIIARCAGRADVIQAVNVARESDLPVAVRGGGHNAAGYGTCDGGIVIDLSQMKAIQVDPSARTVRAEAGVTWQELDEATQEFGLATPGGVVSDTGIAGLTLGGGIGWLRRKYGLSCDNLLSAEIVTAGGQHLTASTTENSDLFWAIQGGGGNFGIVTTFEYQLHPIGPEMMFCFVFHHGDRAKEALQFYREYTAKAPDEVTTMAVLGTVPAEAPFPEDNWGHPFVLFGACYAGPVEAGKQALQPLRDFSTPILDFSGPTPYLEMQQAFDEDYPSHELHYYWKSTFLDHLDDEVIDALIHHAQQRPSPISTLDIWQMGGAIRRVGPEESAYSAREAPFLLGIEGNWESPEKDAANIRWARNCFADMSRFAGGTQYLNFPGFMEEGEEGLRKSFGTSYERLARLKQKYDPTNLFRLNQNIKPET